MGYLGLSAELTPDLYGIIDTYGDVVGHVGALVRELIHPLVLVFLADALAGWVVMVGAKVERIDSARSPVDEREG